MNILAPDVLVDLPEAIHNDMRDLLGRLADAGLPLERNPNMPSMIATKIAGRLFQVTVLFSGGFPSRVAILGPGEPPIFGDPNALPLEEWDRDTFLALVPDPPPETEPAPMPQMSPLKLLPDQREILLEIRDELRAIRERLP